MALDRLPFSGAHAFSQIENRFAAEHGGKDHAIRGDARGLYTSSKASLAAVKQFFGFSAQMDAREAKRSQGVTQIKLAIDSQYGAGMSKRVFDHLSDAGVSLSGGVKRSDLKDIRASIDLLRARDAALADTATGLSGTSPDASAFRGFVTRHFDVCASPAFWSHTKAISNGDTIGAALSLSVLQRIDTAGTVTPKDLADLGKALNPHAENGLQPMAVPAVATGPLTGATFKTLASLVLERYVKEDATVFSETSDRIPMNLTGAERNAAAAVLADPAATRADLVQALQTAHTQHLTGVGFSADRLTDPLRAIS